MNNKDYFDKVSEKWDEMRKEFYSENVREKVINQIDLRKDIIAADIGAGTGFITEGLIKLGIKVIAVDKSPKMIEQMKKKFKDCELIEYKIVTSDTLPIENNFIDYVFANMYLHHIENPQKAINEMVRILKLGGKLILTDLDKHNFEFLKTEQNDFWLGFDRETIKKWFIESGLIDVKVDCIGENCCSKSTNSNNIAKISIFIATGIKK
ncbi:MAG: class I SAM-dependent methyltransferase [Caldisericia bacterium]|nr:class I SAM-dependent methyltransferase [Caldisericia bacterium]